MLYALNPVKNVAVVSAAMSRIPERLRARVVALWDLLPALTTSLGAALMGLALQYAGPSAAVLAAAAIMLLLALAATGTAAIRDAPLAGG